MTAKIITLAIQKGGSGKTTNSANIAHTMGQKNYKVLLVDIDPQASLTNWYGFSEFEKEDNLYTLIDTQEGTPVNVALNVDLLKGSNLLQELESIEKLPLDLLKKALKPFVEIYDYIIIDTPPAVGNLTKIAIFASSKTFVPIQATPLAFRGINSILRVIEEVEKTDNHDRLGGIFLCCTHSNQNLTKIIKENLDGKYEPFNMKANIRSSVDVASSMLAQQSVIEFAPNSLVKLDYFNLTDEILERINEN